ncbi:hypothetical protein T4D_11780 [Trichinella pseudospiralis]|uniref:Uncharacterized protein n=1 Tax=Trichinella pseudospiralis TaxID=6337 RepID=A0A0V1E6G2_TRIPS|nr:hypothetical protein T4D_11780 [Trichinella pseudospiralis]
MATPFTSFYSLCFSLMPNCDEIPICVKEWKMY